MAESSEIYTTGTLYNIRLDEISIDPDQPRTVSNKVADEELEESIRRNGVIEPIIFRIDDNNEKIIVAGARRWTASIAIDSETIPAMFYEKDDYFLVSYSENAIRDDFHPIDDANSIARIADEFNMNQEQLRDYFKKSRTAISDRIGIANMPDAVKQRALTITSISLRQLLEVKRIDGEAEQLAMLDQIELRLNNSNDDPPVAEEPQSASEESPAVEVVPQENNDDQTTENNDGHGSPPPKKVIRANNAINRITQKLDEILKWKKVDHQKLVTEELTLLKAKLDEYFSLPEHQTTTIDEIDSDTDSQATEPETTTDSNEVAQDQSSSGRQIESLEDMVANV